MKPILAACLAAVSALLAGCYESKALLLDARQAATPLLVGTQTLADEGEQPYAVDISLGPDRWYTINTHDGRDEADRFLFTPLAGAAPGVFAFAVGGRGGYMYGVAEQRDGRVYLDVPFCDLGPAREAAIAHGVKVAARGAMAPVCTFARTSDLVGALADYARASDKANLPNLPAAR